MYRFLLLLLVGLLMASPLAAQDAELAADADEVSQDADLAEDAGEVSQEAADEPEPEPEEEPVEYDETGLDEQGFADEDDDFDPTEAIPTDQSIDFPADI